MKAFLRRFLGRRYKTSPSNGACQGCADDVRREQLAVRQRLHAIAGRVHALQIEADLIAARERGRHDRDGS